MRVRLPRDDAGIEDVSDASRRVSADGVLGRKLLVEHERQEVPELVDVGRRQRRDELALHLLDEGPQAQELAAPVLGQGDGVAPGVGGVAPPVDEAAALHAGDQVGDRGAVEVHLVAQLALTGVQRLYIDGGAVIRQFLAENLIDDLTLSIVPLLLGQGVALFGAEVPEQRLRLESCKSYESGLVQLCYERPDAASD